MTEEMIGPDDADTVEADLDEVETPIPDEDLDDSDGGEVGDHTDE
jgi:hypothetical protein